MIYAGFFGDRASAMDGVLYKKPVSDREICQDAFFRCQAARLAHRLHARGAPHVQIYEYDSPHHYALHSSDMEATFGIGKAPAIITPPDDVVKSVQTALVSFAVHGVAEV